jgi:hypothetical protein
VQAQDYLSSLYAVGLRMRRARERDVEQALADKTIVRTWPMRGTLHFVAAEDARWMLLLTGRIFEGRERLHRLMGIDEKTLTRSKKVLEKTLAGGTQLKRSAVYELLEGAKISTGGGRGLHIMWRLAQDAFICFGAREGKQQTFALFDEWIPPGKKMTRDESLAELARRYFTSHGPATLQDFAWWSGLKIADAGAALEMARSHLREETFSGQTFWISAAASDIPPDHAGAYLLPPFDEYTVAYRDRSAVLKPAYAALVQSGYAIFNPTVVVGGQVVGTWKRRFEKDSVGITLSPFERLNAARKRAVEAAAEQYAKFLDIPVSSIEYVKSSNAESHLGT